MVRHAIQNTTNITPVKTQSRKWEATCAAKPQRQEAAARANYRVCHPTHQVRLSGRGVEEALRKMDQSGLRLGVNSLLCQLAYPRGPGGKEGDDHVLYIDIQMSTIGIEREVCMCVVHQRTPKSMYLEPPLLSYRFPFSFSFFLPHAQPKI